MVSKISTGAAYDGSAAGATAPYTHFARVVGMARCAVPVAERSVRRRTRITLDGHLAPFVPPAIARAGTAQRAIPTIGKRQMRIRCSLGGAYPDTAPGRRRFPPERGSATRSAWQAEPMSEPTSASLRL